MKLKKGSMLYIYVGKLIFRILVLGRSCGHIGCARSILT